MSSERQAFPLERFAAPAALSRANIGWWVLCAAIVLIGVPYDLTKVMHHDVAYFFHASGRMLDGELLYRDIIELNPPVVYWLGMIPMALARLLGADPVLTFHVLIVVLAFASVAASVHVARVVGACGAMPAHWIAPPALVAFLVLPSFNFGQREHILAMLLLPYLVSAAGIRTRLPAAAGVLVGVSAGIGIALKPHFLLYLVLTEAIVLLRGRDWRSVFRPEPVVAALVAAAAAVMTVILYPDYLASVVPLGRAIYAGYENPLAVLVVQRNFLFAVLFLACLVAAIFMRATAEARNLLIVFVGAALAAMAAYFAQMKGWRYQSMPILIFASVGLTVAIASAIAAETRRPARRRSDSPILAGALLMLLAMAIGASNWVDDRKTRSEVGPLIELAAHKAAGAPILFFSTLLPYGFPVVNYSGATWPHHYHHMLPLPGLYLDYDPTKTGRSFRTPAEMGAIETRFFGTVVTDAVNSAPRLIYVDRNLQLSPIAELGFDFIDYFSQDPRFTELMAHYKLTGIISGYEVLERVD